MKLKQFVIIQKKRKDSKFKCYCYPYIGVTSGVSPEKYVIRLDGRHEQYLAPHQIESKYGKTHTIIYFNHVKDYGEK